MYFKPELLEYNGDRGHFIGVIFTDHYCRYGQYIFQPVKKLFWNIYINNGKSFYTWDGCLEEV